MQQVSALAVLVLAIGAALLAPAHAQVDSWENRSGMPTSRVFHASCAANGKVYVFGGQRMGGGAAIASVEEYDPGDDTWRPRSDMPSPLAGSTASEVGGKCYLISGASMPGGTAVALVHEYDPGADSWRRVADIPTARVSGASAVIDGKIFVVGGWEAATPQSAVVAALEVYDPATDSWSSGADLPMPRALLAASALGGELYAIGGGSAALGEFNTALVHRYDAEADTWSQAASLPTARGSLAAVTVGERIFAVGGGFNTPGLATVEIYDADSDAWSPASPMPTARWGVTGSVVNGRLYAVGGSTQVGAAHNAVVTNEAYQALAFNINPGLNDAWYQQATSGQGFFIIVLPDTGIIFMAWFTFDTERPDQDVAAMLGEPGHRWLTAQGPFLGDTAVLDVYLTEGGVFDAGTPKPVTGPPIGTITIVWQDCEHATLTYEIDPPGVMGAIPITRVAPDNVALCEAYY